MVTSLSLGQNHFYLGHSSARRSSRSQTYHPSYTLTLFPSWFQVWSWPIQFLWGPWLETTSMGPLTTKILTEDWPPVHPNVSHSDGLNMNTLDPLNSMAKGKQNHNTPYNVCIRAPSLHHFIVSLVFTNILYAIKANLRGQTTCGQSTRDKLQCEYHCENTH